MAHQELKRGFVCACMLVAACAVGTRCAAQDGADGDGVRQLVEKYGATAVSVPDQFAWRLFALINKPASEGKQDAVWETWATDEFTFPKEPDPQSPPKWEDRLKQPLQLRPSVQRRIVRELHDHSRREGGEQPRLEIVPDADAPGTEEVRRNQSTFDYIISNKLFYLEGQEEAVKNGEPIAFPTDAVEIKAVWKAIKPSEKPAYHWNTDPKDANKIYGLVALHVTSKVLPNWHWATFEHKDNLERGDVLGVHDAFGVEPPNSLAGVPSEALKELFKEEGLSDEWLNYRLDGSQIDFTDATGRPTLLGNSVIEQGFVNTSSCITCHGRASRSTGGDRLSVFKTFPPTNPSSPIGHVGAIDPEWYYTAGGSAKFLPMDFVWGTLRARPAKSRNQKSDAR